MKYKSLVCVVATACFAGCWFESDSDAKKAVAKQLVQVDLKNDNMRVVVDVNKDDIKAAINVWQNSRWKNDEIIAARSKSGKVRIDDLAFTCNLPEMQPIADLLIADYVIAVNVLDSFVSTPNIEEAVKSLMASISIEDVIKMMSDTAKVLLDMKDLEDKIKNNKWKFMKDTYQITTMSSSMSGGLKIIKSILEKNSIKMKCNVQM